MTTSRPQKIRIIANGGARQMIDKSARDAFVAMVKRDLPAAEIAFTTPDTKVGALVAAAIREGATMIVAGGGDGTVNAVATSLLQTDVVLGVLPLGTLNHFAGDLGIPQELESAVKLLTNGKVVQVDVGSVNERIFVNNSGLGLYPDMVANREERQRSGAGKWSAAFSESVRAFVKYKLITIRVDVDEGGKERSFERNTPAVFIGNNEYSKTTAEIGAKRPSLTRGELSLYIPHATARARLVWFSVRAFFGIPKSDAEFDKVLTRSFTIESQHAKLHVSIDGEVTTMQTPLAYTSLPKALNVLVPHSSVI